MRFSKEEMNKASKTIRAYLKKNNKYPASVTMTEMDTKKSKKLSKKQYMGLFEAENVFRIKKGRQPNYVTLVGTASNPLVIDYQDWSMSCCPTSLSMCSQMLFNYKSEAQCRTALGTDKKAGTSPSQLVSGAKKLGFKVTPVKRTAANIKAALAKKKPLIIHLETKPATCLGYAKNYGHYVCGYALTKDGKIKIADPTKGLKTCSISTIVKATNGRDLKFYIVELA